MKCDLGPSILDFLPVSQGSLFGDVAAVSPRPLFPKLSCCPPVRGCWADAMEPRSEWGHLAEEDGQEKGWALPGL